MGGEYVELIERIVESAQIADCGLPGEPADCGLRIRKGRCNSSELCVSRFFTTARPKTRRKLRRTSPARSPVVAALKRLGHRVTPIACTLDLAAIRRRLLRAKPDVVFNRVESLGGSDSMMAAITLLLDAMQIPYTGNSTCGARGDGKQSLRERAAVRTQGCRRRGGYDRGRMRIAVAQSENCTAITQSEIHPQVGLRTRFV